MSQDKKAAGLYEKFTVTRNDGRSAPGEKHDGCEYFVLDLTHDPFALPAIRAYAETCRAEYPNLARDLVTQWGAMVLSGLDRRAVSEGEKALSGALAVFDAATTKLPTSWSGDSPVALFVEAALNLRALLSGDASSQTRELKLPERRALIAAMRRELRVRLGHSEAGLDHEQMADDVLAALTALGYGQPVVASSQPREQALPTKYVPEEITAREREEWSEYGLLGGAYLAVETALAKRLHADRVRDKDPDEWPGDDWHGLGQTSHETFWQLAREEAGLPRTGDFKRQLLAAATSGQPVVASSLAPEVRERIEARTAHSKKMGSVYVTLEIEEAEALLDALQKDG